MKKSLKIIFILLNFHLFLGDDEDHCKDYDYSFDEDYMDLWCIECYDGYYLEKDICHKNLCVEGEKEDSCSECKSDGRCYSCYSDDYSVYERYKCKKTFLQCGNNTIKNCEECEIVNGNQTGICKQCYSEYIKSNNTCNYNYRLNNMDRIKVNKFLIYFMILFLLLIN